MVKQCPKLEILHIGGFFTPKIFLSNLGDALKFAKNLRDLRYNMIIAYNQSGIVIV